MDHRERAGAEAGQTLPEYAMVLAVVALVVVVALAALNEQIVAVIAAVSEELRSRL